MTQAESQIPRTDADWRMLKQFSANDLAGLGMRPFNQRGKRNEKPFGDKVLMLFPAEWYTHIPTGYHVVNIQGLKTAFNANTHALPFTSVGFLAYGVLV
jgi:hypothetical protein